MGIWILISIITIWLGVALGISEGGSGSFQRARAASQQSVGLSPDPSSVEEPIIQAFAARTWGSKSAFAVHTWIATKRKGASTYTTYQIIGWRLRRAGTALVVEERMPDRPWYGSEPTLLLDLRGDDVEAIIDKVEQAVEDYPYKNEYTVYPGPNSNTFLAYIGRAVPDLGLDLPATAIGKDYRPLTEIVGLSASGSGVQASLYGVFGFAMGYEEGLEMNLFGLNMELDLFDLAVELPGIGRIGRSPNP